MIIDSTKAPMTQNHCYTQPFIELFNEDCLQTLSKFEDNSIYALEEKETEENLLLEEYRYTINKGNVEKELLNTYEIKLKKQK